MRAATDREPSLASIATSTSNVYPENTLVGRLQAGQLDVGFFYAAEAKAANIQTVPLTGQTLSAHYTITVLNKAPHEAAAEAFVTYLLSPAAKPALNADGFDLVTPPTVTGTGVPSSLQSATVRAVNSRTIRSPFTWLGGLLVVYLAVPVAAFVIRFAGSNNRGFDTPGLWSALRVSIFGASIATALIALLGIPLAYSLARSQSRLAGAVGVAVQLPLALPPLMSGILLIYMVGPYTTLGRLFDGRLTNSLTGVILAQSFVAAPFLVIAARSAFSSVDPALDEVAATLGHRPLARFLRVSLPVAAPGISAGLLLAWLRAFGEYGATVLLAYPPLLVARLHRCAVREHGPLPDPGPDRLGLGRSGSGSRPQPPAPASPTPRAWCARPAQRGAQAACPASPFGRQGDPRGVRSRRQRR